MKIEIPGIDANAALDTCDGDEDIYVSVLHCFVSKIPALLDTLRDVSSETLPDYMIKIHSLKGSGGNIGAKDTMAAAAELEIMAKNGDLDGVLAKNGAFLEKTRVLVDDIKTWLEQTNASA